ncbi:hypothetical protein SH1V18_29180 [Vallitalea longa]|uniref:Phosphodiester glycosidase domain-containing protein n=1 Tax=Vallitalea longa TaxID=2936439 RepID=A0A9W6DGG4_9FIRM|nr:phosphodiester glycosidase family protein [Vallitalea longa]GKX30438.1 hypothetical protein SH1V18_29180 [Vallitalea longa]
MRKLFKKLFSVFVLIALVINNNVLFAGSTDNILYEDTEKETISSGITYEKITRLTEAGWVDVHIIEADLTNPYVKMDVMRNTDGFGIKESLTNIATENRAIAGVNADFFNMRNNPTDIIGFEYEKDGIIVGKHNFNAGGNSYGSFFLDANNMPFTDFMKMRLLVTSEDGEKELYIAGFNQVTAGDAAVYYDKFAMPDTKEIDERTPGLSKMVIEDNEVTYLSAPGELVTMPESGFVIAMPEETAFYCFQNFPVGTKIKVNTDTNIDLTNINLAISGGGKILTNGQISNEGYVVGRNQRHPRTAIGYNQSRDKLYMVVVDGRGSSIGANHDELGKILLDIGLYDAIHLDGGGSSTLVGRHLGNTYVNVFNKPSGGVQRKIANAIGVTSIAPTSDLHEIVVTADKTRVFKDIPISFTVLGHDKYYNPVVIYPDDINWQVEGVEGEWDNNIFYPSEAGVATITAEVNDITADMTVKCFDEPISMEINNEFSFLEPGEKTNLSILGIDEDGYRGEINSKNVKWEAVNKNIGEFIDGQFVAGKNFGQTIIKGTIGNTTVYGYVIVSLEQELVDSFENDTKIHGIVSSDTVTADTEVINEGQEGNNSIKLEYSFQQSEATQVAYVAFDNPYVFDQKLNKLGLWVEGNNMNHWLRGMITDAEGKQQLISFASSVDFEGWKYVTANVPQDMKYPVKLDRIYIASLRCPQEATFKLKFDGLTAHYAFDTSDLTLPNQEIYDPLGKKTIENPEMTMSVFGSTSSKNRLLDGIVQRNVLSQMENTSDVSLFVGNTDIQGNELNNDIVVWDNKYKVTDYDNVRIINLATSKNSMRLTDPNQWKRFVNDLNATEQKHIFITLDKNPLTFTDKRESELLRDILKDFHEKTGKNIFVINGSGYKFNIEYVEGIRYMDINGLWYKVHDDNKVDLNDKFYIINFNISADDISYNVTNVYPK